ncbi:MAG: hypothetical protein ABI882_05755 [Acidobacteriota bacterium]
MTRFSSHPQREECQQGEATHNQRPRLSEDSDQSQRQHDQGAGRREDHETSEKRERGTFEFAIPACSRLQFVHNTCSLESKLVVDAGAQTIDALSNHPANDNLRAAGNGIVIKSLLV